MGSEVKTQRTTDCNTVQGILSKTLLTFLSKTIYWSMYLMTEVDNSFSCVYIIIIMIWKLQLSAAAIAKPKSSQGGKQCDVIDVTSST